MTYRTLFSLAATALIAVSVAQSPQLVNSLSVAGSASDLSPGNHPNENRLGMSSDFYFDRRNGALYSLADRGPGGGTIGFETRVQKVKVNINNKTGEISNFRVQASIKFETPDGLGNFNGLNPLLLNGNVSTLGLSFDPEGFTVGANGNYFVADEYGPSVYEFQPIEQSNGSIVARFVRAFEVPANILPMAGTFLDFVNGRGTLTSGRQDNRGYEGLTISPDGSKLYAILQDPLINDGSAPGDGRRSRNLRIVEYDVATGQCERQFAYQLETVADINLRIPGTSADFGATAQGRNIGCSSITAINDHEFFVIERDNRGRGVDDPLAALPVGSKRVYRIDIDNATDVSNHSFAPNNLTLPIGVTPVSKTLYLDIAEALANANMIIPEKVEGLAIGPVLKDGSFSILLGNDNDFSVTQNSSGLQFDVYTDGTQGAIGGDPMGRELMPSLYIAFKGSVPGFVEQER